MNRGVRESCDSLRRAEAVGGVWSDEETVTFLT